jgi:hypothetical protein
MQSAPARVYTSARSRTWGASWFDAPQINLNHSPCSSDSNGEALRTTRTPPTVSVRSVPPQLPVCARELSREGRQARFQKESRALGITLEMHQPRPWGAGSLLIPPWTGRCEGSPRRASRGKAPTGRKGECTGASVCQSERLKSKGGLVDEHCEPSQRPNGDPPHDAGLCLGVSRGRVRYNP